MSLPYEHVSRRGDAVHLRIIAGRRVDEFLGYHAVVNDLLIGIDVVQIGVQRLHTLLKACFKTVELIGFDDARHGIIGGTTDRDIRRPCIRRNAHRCG